MSIELFLVVNLTADLALLSAVSRSLGLFRWRRIAVAAALCAAYSALAAARPVPWASPPVQLALLAGISLLLTHRAAPRMTGITALALGCAALVCGGAGALIARTGPGAMPACVGTGALLTALLYAGKPPQAGSPQVWLACSINGRVVRFPALIDTGNRLREPLSNLPVVIAEAGLMAGMLPATGYRVLRYGAVGGEGRMACFRPDALWIEGHGRRQPAPRMWIALSPEPLPGLYRALAPPEVALYTASNP